MNCKYEFQFIYFRAYGHLAAGLIVGLTTLASGIAIGAVSKAGFPVLLNEPASYFWFVIMLVFVEALGLYGLIVALLSINTKRSN